MRRVPATKPTMASSLASMLAVLSSRHLFAVASASATSSADGSEAQRILHVAWPSPSGLDDEVIKIVQGSARPENDDQDLLLPYQKGRCGGDNGGTDANAKRGNLRRRTDRTVSYSPELVRTHLLNTTWDFVQAIQFPAPFLLCAREANVFVDLFEGANRTFFELPQETSSFPGMANDIKCFGSSITAEFAREIRDKQDMALVQPVVDIMKFEHGLIAAVTSRGWSVPYDGPLDAMPDDAVKPTNSTYAKGNQWERVISVYLVPGLSIFEVDALLQAVEAIMAAVQDMAEIGWLDRQEVSEERRQYVVAKSSLEGVHSLTDRFSITSIVQKDRGFAEGNERIAFWDTSFSNGLEADHACREMFSTLAVHPTTSVAMAETNGNADYSYGDEEEFIGFNLVLNPNDGPPPQEYSSSASNTFCVTSLLAGLSVHPHVYRLGAKFPIEQGWRVAYEIDKK